MRFDSKAADSSSPQRRKGTSLSKKPPTKKCDGKKCESATVIKYAKLKEELLGEVAKLEEQVSRARRHRN